MKRWLTAFLIMALLLASFGCKRADSTIVAVPTSTFSVSTPEATATPWPSVSPTATATPSPTATKTPKPTSTPEAGITVTSKNLGIKFTLPSYWKGRYTLKEKTESVLVYFKPSIPVDEMYDGFLFSITRKTADNAGEKDFMDGYHEVKVGSVTYMCGGPTDLTYEGPEQDLFSRMGGDAFSIYATIRKA